MSPCPEGGDDKMGEGEGAERGALGFVGPVGWRGNFWQVDGRQLPRGVRLVPIVERFNHNGRDDSSELPPTEEGRIQHRQN